VNKKRVTKWNVLKFVLATITFYALLTINIFNVGEKITPTEKDYLRLETPEYTWGQTTGDLAIQQAMQEIQTDTQTHPSAGNETGDTTGNIQDQINFQKICNANTSLCDEITFDKQLTDKDRYLYLASVFKVVNFMDNNIITRQKAENTLADIEINKDMGERRGYATHTSVIVNLWTIADRSEFLQVISHELGHIFDLGIIVGSSSPKNTTYTEFEKPVFWSDDASLKYYAVSRDSETIRKATATKKDFCSGYGMSDPFEDFAECFNLYLHHNALFRQIAKADSALKQKYNFIAGFFDGKYMDANKGEITLVQTSLSRRPWDSTKIN